MCLRTFDGDGRIARSALPPISKNYCREASANRQGNYSTKETFRRKKGFELVGDGGAWVDGWWGTTRPPPRLLSGLSVGRRECAAPDFRKSNPSYRLLGNQAYLIRITRPDRRHAATNVTVPSAFACSWTPTVQFPGNGFATASFPRSDSAIAVVTVTNGTEKE